MSHAYWRVPSLQLYLELAKLTSSKLVWARLTPGAGCIMVSARPWYNDDNACGCRPQVLDVYDTGVCAVMTLYLPVERGARGWHARATSQFHGPPRAGRAITITVAMFLFRVFFPPLLIYIIDGDVRGNIHKCARSQSSSFPAGPNPSFRTPRPSAVFCRCRYIILYIISTGGQAYSFYFFSYCYYYSLTR